MKTERLKTMAFYILSNTQATSTNRLGGISYTSRITPKTNFSNILSKIFKTFIYTTQQVILQTPCYFQSFPDLQKLAVKTLPLSNLFQPKFHIHFRFYHCGCLSQHKVSQETSSLYVSSSDWSGDKAGNQWHNMTWTSSSDHNVKIKC